MAWNQPEERGSRPPPRQQQPLGGGWRRLRALLAGRGGFGGTAFLAGLSAVLVAGWLLTGLYKVEPGQRGALLRLGAWSGELAPGTGWHLPWPIEEAVIIDARKLLDAGFQSRLFTADQSLVNATFSVQFTLDDARAALLNLRDAAATAHLAAEARAREAVASQPLAGLVSGTARGEVLARLRAGLQQDLGRLGTGLAVQSVELTDLQVPEAVLGAQRSVHVAAEDRARRVREAEGEATDLLARARAAGEKQKLEAEAYRLQAVGTAEGDAVRFEQLLPAYEKNPQVLRDRLFIETIETILARSRKLVLDGKGAGSNLYLPLDKLFDASAARGTGVSGVLDEQAIAPQAAAPAPAPTPAPSAAAGAATPASAAAPATAAAPGAGAPAGRGARDDRSREREVR